MAAVPLRLSAPLVAPSVPVWMYRDQAGVAGTSSSRTCVFAAPSAPVAAAVPAVIPRPIRARRASARAATRGLSRSVFFMAEGDSSDASKDEQKSGGGGGNGGGNGLNKFWRWYKNELDTKPIFTKSYTSAVIFTASDITSQLISNRGTDKPLDCLRTSKMALFGFVYNGPVLHYWFNILQGLIKGTALPAIIGKTLIDQFFMSPIYTTCFFTFQGVLAGESPQLILARLKRDVFSTVRAGWCYWIPAQAINLKFVPPELMLLFQNAASYLWNIYLCSLGAKGSATEEEAAPKKIEEVKEAAEKK